MSPFRALLPSLIVLFTACGLLFPPEETEPDGGVLAIDAGQGSPDAGSLPQRADAGAPLPQGAIWDVVGDFPYGVAVDETHVYVTVLNGGIAGIAYVARIPKSGGAHQVLADKLTLPWRVAVDATHVWYLANTNYLQRVPKAGGTAENVFTPASTCLVLTDTDLFFASAPLGGQGNLYRLPKGATEGERFTDVGYPSALAVDATHYYVSANDPSTPGAKVLLKVPRAGGASTQLAKTKLAGSQYSVFSQVAVDDTNVWWLETRNAFRLWRMPKDESQPPTEFATGATFAVNGFAIDDRYVYAFVDNKLRYAPKSGGTMQVLADGTGVTQDGIWAANLAQDATTLYWVSSSYLMATPKPQ